MNLIFNKNDLTEGLLYLLNQNHYKEVLFIAVLKKKIERLELEYTEAKRKKRYLFPADAENWKNLSQRDKLKYNSLIKKINKTLNQYNQYMRLYNKQNFSDKDYSKLTKVVEKSLDYVKGKNEQQPR